MRRAFLLAACVLAASAARAEDALTLANKGKVAGAVTRITVRMGPIRKTLDRADIHSITLRKGQWVVRDKDGTEYVGSLASVRIQSVAGPIAFDGKSIRAITLNAKNGTVSPPTAPVELLVDEGAPDSGKPLGKQSRAVRALLRTAAALQARHLKRAGELAEAEARTVRQTYAKALAKARRDVERFAEQSDKGNGEGDAALKEAETARDNLLRRIGTANAAVRKRAKKRRNRIRAYHRAIARYVATGKDMRGKAMNRIFEKALSPGK